MAIDTPDLESKLHVVPLPKKCVKTLLINSPRVAVRVFTGHWDVVVSEGTGGGN